MARACFPMFPNFQHGKYCFQCLFLFSRCKLCLRYTTGNFNENPSMRALAKLLRVRTSERTSNFCEHFQIEWVHSIPLMNMLHKSIYHINTNEIPSELSRENMISLHVKRSPLLGLHVKIAPFDALFFI